MKLSKILLGFISIFIFSLSSSNQLSKLDVIDSSYPIKTSEKRKNEQQNSNTDLSTFSAASGANIVTYDVSSKKTETDFLNPNVYRRLFCF